MQFTRPLSGVLRYEIVLTIVVCAYMPAADAQPSLHFETESMRPHHWPPRPVYDVVFLDRGSTLGFGVEATKGINPKFDIRMSFDQFRDFDRSQEAAVDYRLTQKFRSASMVLDWHPFGGAFRTSVGVLINKHSLSLDAVPTQSFDLSHEDMTTLSLISQSDITDAALDDIDLSIIKLSENILGTLDLDSTSIEASDLLTAKSQVEFGNLATYVGIGWGNATRTNGRLRYSFDIGIVFLGSPKVEVDVQGLIPDAIRPYAGPELQAILAAEKKELEEELEDSEIFPLVSFGLSYRF